MKPVVLLSGGLDSDCRPELMRAFEALASVATAPGDPWRMRTPLIVLTKAQIIALGTSLGVPRASTHSCYDPDAEGSACGHRDACALRRQGFLDAGVLDPTRCA